MAEPTWTWSGLIKGDPYGMGTPGKPLPAGVAAPPPAALGTRANPFTQPGQGDPGQFWRGSRKGQFGFPQAAPLPSDIGENRAIMQEYGTRTPAGKQQFDFDFPGFSEMWQGVFNMPQEDFNLGPQMASVPLGEGAASPWAPIAGWQPAQAEEWGV